MRIRPINQSDAEIYKKWYSIDKHGHIPIDFSRPDFVMVLVAVDDDDIPVMAIGARATVEMQLIANPEWSTPGNRLKALKAIHKAMFYDLISRGFRSAHCWIPKCIGRAYGKRLSALGWVEDTWKSYTLEV